MPPLEAVEESLARVRGTLERRVAAAGGRVGDHLARTIGRPGKMLRARYCLLLGRALGVEEAERERAAAVVELVHNASLLHDDCVDEALHRRGHATPNAQFGSTVGVLMGDLSFAEGLDEALALSPGAARLLVEAVREMTVGELQEEFITGSLNVSVEGYFGIAARKTGALFEWAGRAFSGLSPLPHRPEGPAAIGRGAGILLQIVDDIHDFTLDAAVSGKDPGQDFRRGKLTLPAILGLDDERSRGELLRLWSERPRDARAAAEAVRVLDSGGHFERARGKAREIMAALRPQVAALPESGAAAELLAFMELMFRREF